MPPKTKKNGANSTAPMTTSQMLGSLLKSARDIMRKDKGLNGDLDRLPLLTWIMFLKFLDDLELQREEEAQVAGKKFKPAIEPPYRWRDWAAEPQGITGDELLAFINNDEAVRADGMKGAGLFAYLRSLSSSNGDNRRDVIAMVFKGVDNRMKSGYLLRDIINMVAGIHFTSSDELHTLGALYESMLREMRDAAGDSGEFYTPRPVVRFMVQVTDPRLGEIVMDPASGTGGFLVEAFNHLEKQVKTVADRKRLQTETITGCEPKSLPYLLCQMNLLLHGLDAPQIDPENALRFKLSEIGEKQRVDVILTNPPFGGEEERGIQGNFPEDRQTAETALLFLQVIMRKLKRHQTLAKRPARAAVVVPNGTLFGDGVCARIKEELLKEFNLHTIVRLPNGVFAPYTGIPTNILFFDRSGPTKEVWYYEQPLPEGRKNYTKTQPMQFEEFNDCRDWWNEREENDQAWKVSARELLDANCNLDRKNPRANVDFEHLPPENSRRHSQKRVTHRRADTRNQACVGGSGMTAAWPSAALGEVLTPAVREYQVDPSAKYPLLGVRLDGQGPFHRETVLGTQTSAARLYKVKTGDFIYSRLFAWRGAFGIIEASLDDHFVSNEFPTFTPTGDRIEAKYLNYWFRLPNVLRQVEADCSGSTPLTRNRYKEQYFFALQIPLPPLNEQRRVVARIDELTAKIAEARRLKGTAIQETAALIPAHLGAKFRSLAEHYPVHSLGELSSHIVDGPHQTPRYLPDKGGVPFVTVKNMVTGKLSFNDLNYVSREDHREFTKRCRAERGDVLYSKDGATKGRPCYIDTDIEFSFFVSVALIKPLRERLDGRYLVHLLNSSWIKDRMIDKSRGDMIPHIVLREIRAFPVPLPSLEKQREIVEKLDVLQAKVDAMKAIQEESAAELHAMLPAILDKAFKGEL